MKRTFIEYIFNPKRTLYGWGYHLITSCVGFLSDETYLKLMFYNRLKYPLNLDNPRTFSEKLQWLKLESKKHPEYTRMVDKATAKDYVASIVGDKYIIPTYGIWNSVDEIDWDSLPDQFVVKSTGDSGGVVVCRDKSKLDIEKAKAKLRGTGARDYAKYNKEFPYRNVPHRFIAEALLDNGHDSDLPDYKFFCFNGEPKYCQVIRDRNTKETIDFYDMNWEHQEFVGLNRYVTNGRIPVEKPSNLLKMEKVARMLSSGFPFVRIDLYSVLDEIYFGEITFFPASGFGCFQPIEWNVKLGDMIKLPIEQTNDK